MADEETCDRCRHSRGPVILICSNPGSEFYAGPVAFDGYCPRFEPEHQATVLARQAGDD